MAHGSGGWEVSDQDAGYSLFQEAVASCPINGCLLSVSLHVGEPRGFSGVSFLRALKSHSWGSILVTSSPPKPPPRLGIDFNTLTFRSLMWYRQCYLYGRHVIFDRIVRERLSEAVIIAENWVTQWRLQLGRPCRSGSSISRVGLLCC